MKTSFQNNNFVLSLALKMRYQVTRKSAICRTSLYNVLQCEITSSNELLRWRMGECKFNFVCVGLPVQMHAEQIEDGGHFVSVSRKFYLIFTSRHTSPLFNTQIGMSTALFNLRLVTVTLRFS